MSFYWDNVDSSFLKSVLLRRAKTQEEREDIEQMEPDDPGLAAGMMAICMQPDEDFCSDFRAEIENDLLPFYPEVQDSLFRALHVEGASREEKQENLANHAESSSLLYHYALAILKIGGMDTQMDAYTKFRRPINISLRETEAEDVPLYAYQQEAVDKLKQHFLQEDEKKGLLVMPTGSGKTRTAAVFLIREMIARGWQVLFIAHRHMLLNQATDAFERFAGLTKIENPGMQKYRLRCISGAHLSIRQVDGGEVILASIQSICRSKAHLRRILGKKVMVVIDEAHHTFAPSYKDTLRFIEKARKNTKVLGLTATPIRANAQDSAALLDLFDHQIIYQIGMKSLIAGGILSSPQHCRISTGTNFEPQISEAEAKLIRRFQELPQTVLNKIASCRVRNALIVKAYMDHREQWGKTLIFALNVLHCRLLCEELKKQGVRCGTVYAGRPGNEAVIADFKENRLDVLVNVNIMTEGSDVPDIQTIFLTRPTQSEGLLMQMIGRGMRGPYAGGTETVNIVDFHDQWETFDKWLNPEDMTAEQEEPLGMPTKVSQAEKQEAEQKQLAWTWKQVREAYAAAAENMQVSYRMQMSVPACWYSLIDADGEDCVLLVYEDQLRGYQAMIKDRASWLEKEEIRPLDLLRRYFSYFCKRPSTEDIQLMMDNLRTLEDLPDAHLIADRKKIDPAEVVRAAEEADVSFFEKAEAVFDESDTAKRLYPDREAYLMAVCAAKVYGEKRPVIGRKIRELPREKCPFDPSPVYDQKALEGMMQEVINSQFGGSYEDIGSISWTDRPYRGYYGKFMKPGNDILINSLLNSRDVPREAIQYVIYHELLHRDYWNHDHAFRREEHKFPQFEKWEAFLDGKMGEMDIPGFRYDA